MRSLSHIMGTLIFFLIESLDCSLFRLYGFVFKTGTINHSAISPRGYFDFLPTNGILLYIL